MPSQPDPKRQRRARDPELLRELHFRWRGDCALVQHGGCDEHHYSLHHVLNKPRDDVEANLVMLCGDGVAGHHGRITRNERLVCQQFAVYLIRHRLDTLAYLGEKLGGLLAVQEWFRSQLYHPI